ncbi:MAG TPA: hypothetical protein VHC20_02470 [Candidatus Paceibacterota bacterium]|nr:hypothetical protein [Candidatus Paceibacterota bacterium]
MKHILYDWLIWSVLVSAIAGYFLGARPKPSLMTLYRAIGLGLAIFSFIYGVHAGMVMGLASLTLTLSFPFALGGFMLFAVDEIHGGHTGRAFNHWVELKWKELATP